MRFVLTFEPSPAFELRRFSSIVMPVTIDLTGKLVLFVSLPRCCSADGRRRITGGGRGLGVSIAREFAAAGASLALTYNATPAHDLAAKLAEEFGVKCRAFQMKAEDSIAVDQVVQQVTKEMGELDVVIANAGICIHGDSQVRRRPSPPLTS